MKILSWNCCKNFRNKCDLIIKLDPDIIIIQECENPKSNKYPKKFMEYMPYYLWIGDRNFQGLGIFSKKKITNNNWDDGGNKYLISCNVNDEFNLIGVWCKEDKVLKKNYIVQLCNYLMINQEAIKRSKCIIAGDLNSFHDYKCRPIEYMHTTVMDRLNHDFKVKSLYHHYNGIDHGNETEYTFYMRKNKEKYYHVDYMLGCKCFYESISNIEIGKYDDWIKFSDHMPLLLEVH